VAPLRRLRIELANERQHLFGGSSVTSHDNLAKYVELGVNSDEWCPDGALRKLSQLGCYFGTVRVWKGSGRSACQSRTGQTVGQRYTCRMLKDQAQQFYASMLNVMAGLQDDLDANDAPQSAKDLLAEAIEECRSDYRLRFAQE